jgi:hypothetical protein
VYVLVRIKRNTDILGAGSRIKIYINDKKVATIKQNKQVELELPSDEAKVSVSQLGVHSNEVIVKNGQVVEITTRSWTYISLILFFVVLASMSVFLPSSYNIIMPIILTVLYLGLYKFIEGFRLKVIYP